LLPEFLNRRRLKFTYPLRVMEDLGIDRPALNFVLGGVALQPDEGARLVDVFNAYSTVFDQWNAAAAAARGAGLVDEVGGKWHATGKGRDLFSRVRREADAFLATLTPIPGPDLSRLAALLGRGLAAIEASDVPKDHIPRTARFKGDGTIAMVALENAIFGLWQARDDCHMASWRAAAFDGPTFDVLTRLWRKEASNEQELATKITQQKPDDIRRALQKLRRDGLVASESLAVTERGASMRQAIEDETDRRFFAPWPGDVGAQGGWIRDHLAAVNAYLAPAS
jgi:helix-turn-helix protein